MLGGLGLSFKTWWECSVLSAHSQHFAETLNSVTSNGDVCPEGRARVR